MIDNAKARGLQEIYKAHGNGALGALALECQRIAFVLVKAQCRKYCLQFERERLEEFAHDAAAQFIAQYLKHGEYSVRSFSGRIRRDVLNVMFGRARNRQDAFEDAQMQFDERYGRIPGDAKESEAINPSTALDELVTSHVQGKKIAADLWRSRSYAVAVRRIAAYVGRQWIYEHAEKMHFVFKAFRWRPRETCRARREGARRIRAGILPGEQSKLFKPGERAHQDAQRRGVK